MGETAPFWRFSASSYPDLESTTPVDGLVTNTNHSPNAATTSSGVRASLYLQRKIDR